MKHIVVIGAGFAGLWAAIGAARKLDELQVGPDTVTVTLINRDPWHAIRVRNYEADLSEARVRLDEVLDPVGVRLVVGDVVSIDSVARAITVVAENAAATVVPYDRLVLAAGSALHRPGIPGLSQHSFDVDTYPAAVRLQDHIEALSTQRPSHGRGTALVIGAGLTGIEVACELPARLTQAGINHPRVILIDRNPQLGSDMGEDARAVISSALDDLGVEVRTGCSVDSVNAAGVQLGGGERVAAHTVVWAAGMRASTLAALLPVPVDPSGRLPVDGFMQVEGVDGIFAAGDVASANLDGTHSSVMSCQHGRPMGRFAGHNVVCDLLGLAPLPLSIDRYATCLDLGPWGALYTEGWERRVVASGAEAKQTKQTINRVRIYPPRSGARAEILEAAAPIIQAPPLKSAADRKPR